MTWLKQSTAVDVSIGPFVDSTDGVTAETALTISQADIRLKKNGGAFAQTNNAAGATHDENGYYEVPLDATDTNTLGILRVAVSESGALPVWRDFMVVPANVWDSFFGADKLQVHADEITAGLITATAIAADAITAAKVAADVTTEIQSGLATAAALTTVAGYIDTEVAAILAAVDTEVAAIKAKTDNLPASPAATGDIPSAATIADAVWDEAIAGHAGAGSTGEALSAAGSAGDPWSTALPGAYGAGTAGKIVGDNLNATVSSRATQTSVDAVDDYVDTELAAVKTVVDAIQAKTDNLPASPAATGDIPTTAAIADKILGRNLAGGADGTRTVQDALRALRNKTAISAGTLTVYQEDDSTSAWTASVTTAAGDPLSGIDPA
jgi:hypothetical protein